MNLPMNMESYRGYHFNHLMGTLKGWSNGPWYSNTVTGTLDVDGVGAVTFCTATGPVPSSVLTVPNVTAQLHIIFAAAL